MHHVILQLGMVQLLGVPQQCPVKLMILTWNNQQFVGHVPSEQVTLVTIALEQFHDVTWCVYIVICNGCCMF